MQKVCILYWASITLHNTVGGWVCHLWPPPLPSSKDQSGDALITHLQPPPWPDPLFLDAPRSNPKKPPLFWATCQERFFFVFHLPFIFTKKKVLRGKSLDIQKFFLCLFLSFQENKLHFYGWLSSYSGTYFLLLWISPKKQGEARNRVARGGGGMSFSAVKFAHKNPHAS